MNSAIHQDNALSVRSTPAGDGVSGRRLNPFQYCLLVSLLPLLAVPLLIQLGRSNFFLHHGASVWVQANDAVFNMHDRDCDVLVFGDSTAMTGIDPDIVEERTGFRTCNIAVTNAVLAVTNDLTLRAFLERNAKPRVLLVQLSPDHFRQENHAWQRTIYAEGLLELLRHADSGQARRVLLTHPQEAIAFAGYAAGFSAWYALKDVWFHTTHLRPEEDGVTVRNGFFTPPAPARTQCTHEVGVADRGSPQDAAFSRSIVSAYQNGFADRAGVVLVNVAPIPSCDQNFIKYSSELRGITSNSLLPLPITLFNDGRHYTARGSQIVSALVAKELNRVAAQNPSIDDRVFPNRANRSAATLRRVRLKVRRSPRRPERERITQGLSLLSLPPLAEAELDFKQPNEL